MYQLLLHGCMSLMLLWKDQLLWELGDEYQLLFCFWGAAQLGPGLAAPTLYCGWSALLEGVLYQGSQLSEI